MVAHKRGALRGATEACMRSTRAQYAGALRGGLLPFYLVTVGGAELV
jgi:hypothetical protein